MITGNSFLLREDFIRDLGFRRQIIDSIQQSDTSLGLSGLGHEPVTALTEVCREQSTRSNRALPLRHLEPHDLDEVYDDVDLYASRLLGSSTLEEAFDVVIATAEMRAGSAIVRDVLLTMASSRDGHTLEELVGSDSDRAISVMHVLAVLGNHLITCNSKFSLTPILRTAVERRYPLGNGETRRRLSLVIADRASQRLRLRETA